jgi:hypothetical protein
LLLPGSWVRSGRFYHKTTGTFESRNPAEQQFLASRDIPRETAAPFNCREHYPGSSDAKGLSICKRKIDGKCRNSGERNWSWRNRTADLRVTNEDDSNSGNH